MDCQLFIFTGNTSLAKSTQDMGCSGCFLFVLHDFLDRPILPQTVKNSKYKGMPNNLLCDYYRLIAAGL